LTTEEETSRSSDTYRGGTNAPPPTYDGSRFGMVFENYTIKAYLWLEHTGLRPTARGPRLLQELTDTAFEAAKHFALDPSWRADPENGQRLLEYLAEPQQFGKEAEEEILDNLRALFYEGKRKPGDSLNKYLAGFRQRYQKVKNSGITLPAEVLGFLTVVGMKLDETDTKMLMTLTQGSLKETEVNKALHKLEARWSKNKESSPAYQLEAAGDDEDQQAFELMEQALDDLGGEEPREYTEEEAREILVMTMKGQGSMGKLSYPQVQRAKQEHRDERNFGRLQKTRLDLDELKRRTRCRECKQLGHWHRECPNKEGGNSSSNGAPTNSYLVEVIADNEHLEVPCWLEETAPGGEVVGAYV